MFYAHLYKFSIFALYLKNMASSEFFHTSGQTNSMVNRFEKMLKHKKAVYFDVAEFGQIIETYLDDNNLNKAAKAIQIGLIQHPGSDELLFSKARLLFLNNKSDDALKILDYLEHNDPDLPDLFVLRGTIMLNKLLVDNAIDSFNHAMKICPPEEQYDLLWDIGEIYMEFELFDEASACFKSALKFNGNDPDLIFNMALSCEYGFNFKSAEYYYNLYLDKQPYDFYAWFLLSNCFTKQGEYLKAIEAIDFSMAVNDQYEINYFQRAYNLYRLSSYNEAIEWFKKFLDFRFNSFISYYILAQCYQNTGDSKNAIKFFRKTIQTDIRMGIYTAEPYLSLGQIYEATGKKGLARRFYYQAFKIDPSNPYVLKAMAFFLAGENIGVSEKYFNQYIRTNPDNEDAYIKYSRILYSKRFFTQLEKITKKGLAHYPNNEEITMLYLLSLIKNGKYRTLKKYNNLLQKEGIINKLIDLAGIDDKGKIYQCIAGK